MSMYDASASYVCAASFHAVIHKTQIRSLFLSVQYNWGVLFLSPIVLFGITGNILVCMAVSMEKRLQSVTNYFLLSLAITDLLVCIIVMPFSLINDFIGKRFNISILSRMPATSVVT